MLESLKQPLYNWLTYRRGARKIAALETDLQGDKPLLLVYQMGRAGSMTTVATLREAGVDLPIYHAHWMHPDNLQKRFNRWAGVREARHPLNVRVGRRIAEHLRARGPGARDWKLVSVFREPVARNISVFFLSIDDFIKDFSRRYENRDIDNAEVLRVFMDKFPHEQPLKWFDMEMAQMYGVDVYRYPFPKEHGYQVIRQDRVDLLLLKVEELNRCYREAFSAYLGVDVPALQQVHITERDPSRPMYRDFIRDAVLPADYLDQMYESRFARHFYRDDEIAAFRRKWGSSQAVAASSPPAELSVVEQGG